MFSSSPVTTPAMDNGEVLCDVPGFIFVAVETFGDDVDVSGNSTGIGRPVSGAVEVVVVEGLRNGTSCSDTVVLVSLGNFLALDVWLVRFLPLSDGCCSTEFTASGWI